MSGQFVKRHALRYRMKKGDTKYLSAFCASIGEKELLASVDASVHFGVTNDYITRLCRQKKVRGFLVGRLWFVEKESLKRYLHDSKQRIEAHRKKLSQSLKSEYMMHLGRAKQPL